MGKKKRNATLQSLPIHKVLEIVTDKEFYHYGGGYELISKIIKPLESLSSNELRELLKVKLEEKSAIDLFGLTNVIKSGLSSKSLISYKYLFNIVLSEAQERYNSIDKPLPKKKSISYPKEKNTYYPSEGGPMVIDRGRGRNSSSISTQYLINSKKKI